MRAVRYWSVSNSGLLEKLYDVFEWFLVKLHPLFKMIGYERLEKPVVFVEKAIKGFLFDCQMCGQCALSSTGMSCSMNCPKNIRNGPCGGVRANGNCEVKPDMRCVWVEAVRGSRKMDEGKLINVVQLPVDYTLKGRSSWLIVARQKGEVAEGAN